MRIHGFLAALFIAGIALAAPLPTRADDQPAPAAAPAPPAPPVPWLDSIKWSGYIETGITANFGDQAHGLNVGHLFTDRADQLLLNQASLIVERPTDPAQGLNFGFRFQGMLGADARYTHFVGELDRTIADRNQLDIVEAHVDAHLPWLTEGGMDFKLGQFVTLLGAETIDPRTNYFYTHSYIFNYGLPLKDTGAMLVMHASPLVDVYTGLITGVNTSLPTGGDNNGALAFEGGIGLNISDALTILATTNIGPENACTPGIPEPYHCNGAFRYFGDVVVTWKMNDKLTSITEFNIVHDDGPEFAPDTTTGKKIKPYAGGVAQYFIYNWSDEIALVGRAEIFRDANGFFVGAFPNQLDFVNAETGRPNTSFFPAPGPTTYGALTFGINYHPPVPEIFKGLVIRPEIRVDDALSGPAPFNPKLKAGFMVGTSRSQATAAIDLILPF